jgi:hypothetical protein
MVRLPFTWSCGGTFWDAPSLGVAVLVGIERYARISSVSLKMFEVRSGTPVSVSLDLVNRNPTHTSIAQILKCIPHEWIEL